MYSSVFLNGQISLREVFIMKELMLLFSLILIAGCVTTSPTVLLETEAYYLIPANTPFRAIVEDGGPVEDVIRNHDSYAVDAGMLIKLQEEANSCLIN